MENSDARYSLTTFKCSILAGAWSH